LAAAKMGLGDEFFKLEEEGNAALLHHLPVLFVVYCFFSSTVVLG
jgi:hypothetical protein